MSKVVIVSGARTAVGSFGGSLKDLKASDLGAIVIREAVTRAGLVGSQVDEVVMGCVGQIAEDAFVARTSALKAGLPVETTALTVNRLCCSGVQSVVTGAMEIMTGSAEIIVAGGTESMSNFPYYNRNARFGYRMGHAELEDGLVTALSDPLTRDHMGITAENIAAEYSITREDQDKFSVESQQKAFAARSAGIFINEIIPITVKINRNEVVFDTDEYLRPDTSLEKLAKLKPAFKKDGTVTAGNASGINDGAGAVVMMTEEKAIELGLKPIVRVAAWAVAGVPPHLMGTGPIPAVRKLLKQTGLSLDEIGLIELNEAFASQSLACVRELGLDMKKVNVNGGAIAFGHPIGGTGAILAIKLMNDMARKGVRYGLETICIGGGQGLAVLFELM